MVYDLGRKELIMSLVFKHEGSMFYFAPEHGNSHVISTACKFCIHWELGVNYFFEVHVTLLHRSGSKCHPLASQQVLQRLKTLLGKHRSSYLKKKYILGICLLVFAKEMDCHTFSLLLLIP